MSVRDIQDVKKVAKGMYRDTNPIDQPANTYRYALNMMLESREGDHSAITNEEGNEACDAVKSGYQVIGTILVNNNDTIVFSTNGTKSEIGILSQSCVYTSLVESTCLNFSRDYPISGIFKIQNGCDRIIYFTDNYNPIRVLNLDNLIQYVNATSTTAAAANAADDWNCTLMKMDPDYDVPTIGLTEVIDGGGSLERGSYFFTIRYLDSEFNPTNWTGFTQNVLIAGGNSSLYDTIDGGNFDLTDNDLFAEGKSISLNLTNLDTTFPYYQLAVIQNTTGVKDEGAAYTLNVESVTGTTGSYIYKGADTQRTVTTLDELVVNSIVFDRVKTITQLDNRMLLANTSSDAKDWAEFQRTSSEIIITALDSGHPKEIARTVSTSESAKSAQFSFSRKSYMRDEVYAFGIVYVFTDGTTSPVFHIPGRPANEADAGGGVTFTNQQLVTTGNANTHNRNLVQDTGAGDPVTDDWDTHLLTVVAAPLANPKTEVLERNVQHIPLSEFTNPANPRLGNTIERWKVMNTAVEYNPGRYLMSYFECDETYPIIEDCSGTSIWGTDALGNTLQGTPVRHHRMPDATLSNIHDGSEGRITDATDSGKQTVDGNIHSLYLNVTNVNYPAAYTSDIQGYYLVRVERDANTETVIDTGIMGRLGAQTPGEYTPGAVDVICDAIGLDTTMDPLAGTAELYKYLFISPKTQFDQSVKNVDYFKFENAYVGITDSTYDYRLVENLELPPNRNVYLHYNSLAYFYIDPETVQFPVAPFTASTENHARDMSFYVWKGDAGILSNSFFTDRTNYYVAAKKWRKPYGNLTALSYINCSEFLTGTGITAESVWGGDTYITELAWKNQIDITGSGTDEKFVHLNNYLASTYNSELRGHGSQEYETHLRFLGGWIDSYFAIDQYPDDPAKDWSINYFKYDKHYSQESNYKEYFPLPLQWDYCPECDEEFPYRIWYSQKSYQEQLSDNYREFLANNYQDILGASGDINKMFVYRDQLYAQTDYATWFISTRPQTMTTNEGNVEIGTGDIFSIPPKRIESVDRGYAGNQHQWTTVVTEFGTFWVDANAGKVFLLAGKGPKDVTLKGMRNWFAENLPFNVLEALPDCNVDSHTSKNGVGLQAYLDPRHNRIILHKRDYKLIGDAATIDSYETYVDPAPNTYGYNSTTGEYYSWNGVSEVIENILSDVSLYEDKSWTISLNLMGENWASFHSYIPMWGFTNRNNFFTTVDGSNTMWKHGSRNYGVYYDATPAPCVLDCIYNSKPYTTKTTNSLQYVSKAEEFSNGKFVEVLWDTWDHLWVYNSNQSSGFLSVQSKQDFNTSNPFVEVAVPTHVPIYARDNEGTFSISEFYDMTINKTDTIVTEDWSNSAYRNARVSYGILDYPNNSAIDLTKNPFEIEPMRDKWLGARLWYSNSNSYKFTTEFVSARNNISFK